MVGIFPLDPNVNRSTQALPQRLEEVWYELRGEFADPLPRKLAFEDGIGTPSKIDPHASLSLVHWQQESVTLNAAFLPQRVPKSLSKSEAHVLHRVMFVDFEIPFASDP